MEGNDRIQVFSLSLREGEYVVPNVYAAQHGVAVTLVTPLHKFTCFADDNPDLEQLWAAATECCANYPDNIAHYSYLITKWQRTADEIEYRRNYLAQRDWLTLGASAILDLIQPVDPDTISYVGAGRFRIFWQDADLARLQVENLCRVEGLEVVQDLYYPPASDLLAVDFRIRRKDASLV